MDPMSALSIALSLFQFLDFSIKLVSKGNEIFSSATGALGQNSQVQKATDTFRDQETRLRESLGINSLTTPKAIVSSEADLLELCHNSLDVAKVLSERLERLKVKGAKHRRWKSIRQALKSVWNKKEINKMRDTLVGHKGDLVLYILMSLQGKISDISANQSKDISLLGSNVKRVLDTILDTQLTLKSGGQASHTALKEMIASTSSEFFTKLNDLTTKTELRTKDRLISDSQRAVEEKIRAILFETITKFREAESITEEKKKRAIATRMILESLKFHGMSDRWESISDAEVDTFHWIFENSPSTLRTWSNLSDWLKGDESLYWVNGKAGAGKSTLMRYVYEHPTTQSHLEAWAGDLPLMKAGFFFWNSGFVQERTQEGLLRSLLYQLLSQNPTLIPVAMPDEWGIAYEGLLLSENSNPLAFYKWSELKLRKLIFNLAKESIGEYKIALFIDGLDEHDSDHSSLINLINTLTGFNHIKALVSSRPLPAFDDAFENFPKLKLQDLTAIDIEIYVDGRLIRDGRYQELVKKDKENATALIKTIVHNAEGVFMWVRLVVNSLLDGITNRDHISDLHRRLLALPKDLEAMYGYMLDKIDPFYSEQSSRLFQLVREILKAHIVPMHHILLVSFAMGETLLDISGPPQLMSHKQLHEREREVEVWLKTRCAGLVEVSELSYPWEGEKSTERNRSYCGQGIMRYIHRSARDYLERPDVWNRIVASTTQRSFNPMISYLRGFVLWLKYVEQRYSFFTPGMDRGLTMEDQGVILRTHGLDFDAINSSRIIGPRSELYRELVKKWLHWTLFFRTQYYVTMPPHNTKGQLRRSSSQETEDQETENQEILPCGYGFQELHKLFQKNLGWSARKRKDELRQTPLGA